jgi:hypothetical protein
MAKSTWMFGYFLFQKSIWSWRSLRWPAAGGPPQNSSFVFGRFSSGVFAPASPPPPDACGPHAVLAPPCLGTLSLVYLPDSPAALSRATRTTHHTALDYRRQFPETNGRGEA